MGLAEKLSEWLLRRRERQEERNMRQVAAYFGSLLNKRRADAGAILQSVRDYRDCPEVTRKQAECCWNTGSSGTCTRRAIPNGGRLWTP